MRSAAFLTIPFAASLLAGSPEPAEARSKSYCRDFAQQLADREAGAAGIEMGVAAGATGGAVIGAALDSQGEPGKAGATEQGGIAVPASDPANGQWQHVYRRAYAECRAS